MHSRHVESATKVLSLVFTGVTFFKGKPNSSRINDIFRS